AYGVGAVAVSQALEALDPWGYGVATIEEGAELRAAGITRPVLVFTPARNDLFDGYREQRLTPALGDGRTVADWIARGARGGAFHLEIDTGMGRSGVRWDEVEPLADLLDTPYLEGCYTQFHSAERNDGSAEQQLERFRLAVGRLARRPALLHVANSAAALKGGSFAFDAVRPGVYLYGGSPGVGLPEGKPVVSVRARVVAVRRVRAGDSVSYNASWTAARDTTIATLGIGYADGLRRSLGAPGTAAYGDAGSDTLGNVARAVGGLRLPNLERLGLGLCRPLRGLSGSIRPSAAYGVALPKSKGKDSTTGHWEICGVLLDKPFRTYPNGFPTTLLDEFARRTGRGWLGNKAASGTAIIAELGKHHQRAHADQPGRLSPDRAGARPGRERVHLRERDRVRPDVGAPQRCGGVS